MPKLLENQLIIN